MAFLDCACPARPPKPDCAQLPQSPCPVPRCHACKRVVGLTSRDMPSPLKMAKIHLVKGHTQQAHPTGSYGVLNEAKGMLSKQATENMPCSPRHGIIGPEAPHYSRLPALIRLLTCLQSPRFPGCRASFVRKRRRTVVCASAMQSFAATGPHPPSKFR